jgi:hypothetical protein
MFEPLGGSMGQSPIKPDYVRQEFFGELMAQRQAFGFGSPVSGQAYAAVAFHAQQAVAVHALERSGHGGRRDFEFLREAGADGGLIILFKLPDGLEVIFPGDASRFARHEGS